MAEPEPLEKEEEGCISLDHIPFILTAAEGPGPGRDCEWAIGIAPIDPLFAARLVCSDNATGGAEADESWVRLPFRCVIGWYPV